MNAMQWFFVNVTDAPNEYEMLNNNVPEDTWLSYSTLVNQGNGIRAQITGNQLFTTWKFTMPSGQYVFFFFFSFSQLT
jgi:hypothetical protein